MKKILASMRDTGTLRSRHPRPGPSQPNKKEDLKTSGI